MCGINAHVFMNGINVMLHAYFKTDKYMRMTYMYYHFPLVNSEVLAKNNKVLKRLNFIHNYNYCRGQHIIQSSTQAYSCC